jgi:hypothetical protein
MSEVIEHVKNILNRLEDAREAFAAWTPPVAVERKPRFNEYGQPILETKPPDDPAEQLENLPGAKALLLRIQNLQRDIQAAETELNLLVAKGSPRKAYVTELMTAESSVNTLVRKLQSSQLNALLDERYGTHDHRTPSSGRDLARLDPTVVKYNRYLYAPTIPARAEGITPEAMDKAYQGVVTALEKVLTLLEDSVPA